MVFNRLGGGNSATTRFYIFRSHAAPFEVCLMVRVQPRQWALDTTGSTLLLCISQAESCSVEATQVTTQLDALARPPAVKTASARLSAPACSAAAHVLFTGRAFVAAVARLEPPCPRRSAATGAVPGAPHSAQGLLGSLARAISALPRQAGVQALVSRRRRYKGIEAGGLYSSC